MNKKPKTLDAALAEIEKLKFDIKILERDVTELEEQVYEIEREEVDTSVIEAISRALGLLKRGSAAAAVQEIELALRDCDPAGKIQGSIVVRAA